METDQSQQQPQIINQVIIQAPKKSVGIAFLLTFFFGPFGLFYSSVIGGIVMLIVDVIIGFITFGLVFFITWPICIIWGCVAANNANKVAAR